jgi:hypothetical protein
LVIVIKKLWEKLSRKSGLTLPVDCPWTVEKILDEDWFPELIHTQK